MKRIIHIKLSQLTLRNKKSVHNSYYSFSYQQQYYFTSVFNHQSQYLNDDIIIPIQQPQPEFILLQRWQNHMIIFTHQIDLSQLKTRKIIKKKYQLRQGEFLGASISVLDHGEIIFGEKFIHTISQHYLMIYNVDLKEQRKRGDPGPSFFTITTTSTKFILPVANAIVYVQLPQTLQFSYHRNGKLFGKSQAIICDEQTTSKIQIPIEGNGKSILVASLKWGINLQKSQIENNILLQSNELLLYQLQVKFQNHNQFTNCRLKIIYGNKACQLTADFNNTKINKFKKIIYFLIKSQDQQICIAVQRNFKIVAQCKFSTDQIIPFQVCQLKKKINDNFSKKIIGNIKFKAEKAKNLSLPQNNILWRQLSRKKTTAVCFILSVQQLSVKYSINQQLMVTIKSQQKQHIFDPIPNINFFEADNIDYHHKRVLLEIKPDQNIYLMIRKHQESKQGQLNESDFIGIAVININSLKLGTNSLQIPFFKNQLQTASVSLIVNKIPPYPFVKPLFQPQLLAQNTSKTINLSLFINKIVLTPYYYTYKYDNKNQVYCIAQVNRVKKVLILNAAQHHQLNFITLPGSDNLDFIIQQCQLIKIKFTLLISDLGYQQEIYANSMIKVKVSQNLQQMTSVFRDIELFNDFRICVGHISVEVTHHIKNGNKQLPKNDLKKNQQQMKSDNVEYLDKSQIYKPKQEKIRKSSRVYSGSSNRYNNNPPTQGSQKPRVKLPVIKQKKKPQKNINDILDLLKVRKRGNSGFYDQIPQTSRRYQNHQKIPHKPILDRSLDLYDLQKNNPNLNRNFQILFPKKSQEKKLKDNRQSKINQQYQDKFKGLKSVMNQIEIGQVQPTIISSRENKYANQTQFNLPEWEGNQFAMLEDKNNR